MKKRILVVGRNGFVGKNLTESLSKNKDFDVVATDSKALNLLDEEEVKSFFKLNYFDVVINCATVGGTRKSGFENKIDETIEKNLRMYFNLERCIPASCHLINFGSGAEYDKRDSIEKIPEKNFDLSVPKDSYGYSKYVIAKRVEGKANITHLRIFGLYGKYEDYTFKFISNAILKNLIGDPITINQNVKFDYLYIDDLIKIVTAFIYNKPDYNFINVTPIESIDLIEIAKLINDISSLKSEVVVLNEGMNKEYTGDNATLMLTIPNFKFVSYYDGIKSLVSYYKDNLNQLDIETIKTDPYAKFCLKN